MSAADVPASRAPTAPHPIPVVGPGLRKLLLVVLVVFALLVVNSVYLGAVSWRQWFSGESLEDAFYQSMFLVHLALGLAITVPALVYGALHLRRAIHRPNRLAVRLGLCLFATVIVLLATGIALTRGLPLVELRDPAGRSVAYWLHVAAPVAVAWLFVLHRLAGRAIRWRVGLAIALVALGLGAAGAWLAEPGGDDGETPADFGPSLARTVSGGTIPAHELMRDDDCARCHADAHAGWQHSAHRFASFNNPAYAFSVRQTRQMLLERDGNVLAARFCAGCHDPAPLFSGRFDDPDFDDENDPTAHAGIGCVACHAIEEVGLRGNADYVIGIPERYPFSASEHPALRWINGMLIKAKPALHKRSLLKPLHKKAAFCGACHKVHLPQELNHYRWLRGQNHYDSFLLSGVSGHGVASFYYPPEAEANCNGCHMRALPSEDFAARRLEEGGPLSVHDHGFPAANTALGHLLDFPPAVFEAHRRMLEGALRVDIFAARIGGDIDAPASAPLRPSLPTLEAGREYVFDIVLRTLTLGHLFTEGTADSNQVWLEVTATSGGRVVGKSGGIDPVDGAVDPWSHFVNAYVLDRHGNRIDRRNAEDIFAPLYNHQIPPGAASTVHYRLRLPERMDAPLEIAARLRYRKFDTTYMRHFQGAAFAGNTLPIVTIAEDRVLFAGSPSTPDVPAWERWNDYGIGLLAKPGRGALRQAEAAFREVARLGRAEGHLNLARVLIREGRLDEAAAALRDAAAGGAYPWSVAWFGAQVDMQNGELDAAIDALVGLRDTRFAEARRRGFDFSRDYRLLNALGGALFERAKLSAVADRGAWLEEAAANYRRALGEDPENAAAHYGLAQVYARLGDERERQHRALHDQYRRDDNALDRAKAIARMRDAAANHAAEAVVVYDLQRPGRGDFAGDEASRKRAVAFAQSR